MGIKVTATVYISYRSFCYSWMDSCLPLINLLNWKSLQNSDKLCLSETWMKRRLLLPLLTIPVTLMLHFKTWVFQTHNLLAFMLKGLHVNEWANLKILLSWRVTLNTTSSNQIFRKLASQHWNYQNVGFCKTSYLDGVQILEWWNAL